MPRQYIKSGKFTKATKLRRPRRGTRPSGYDAITSQIARTYRVFRRGAVERLLPVEIDYKTWYNFTQQNCFYCNIPPSNCCKPDPRLVNNESFFYNGIDRVDNSIGYLLHNCVTCCKDCNVAKRDRSKEEFMLWIQKIYKKHFMALPTLD